MKPYVYFYVEIIHALHQPHQPSQTFYSFYSDGKYEKAVVYEENDDLSHSMKTGTMMMKQMLKLQNFVVNHFPQVYCRKDGFGDEYTFVAYHFDGSIIHETVTRNVYKYISALTVRLI